MCDRYGAAAFGAPWRAGGEANAPALEELFALFDFWDCTLSRSLSFGRKYIKTIGLVGISPAASS
jgi:hypothetical protein